MDQYGFITREEWISRFFLSSKNISKIHCIVQTASIQTCPTPFTTLDDCNRDDFAAYQLL